MRGSPSQPGLSLGLSPRAGPADSEPLDVLKERPRSVPRERGLSASVRECASPLHEGRTRWRRRFCNRRQLHQADATRTRGVTGDQVPNWEEPSRAVREYLEGLERTNPVAADDNDPPPERNVSLTDPAAHWTAAPGGPPSPQRKVPKAIVRGQRRRAPKTDRRFVSPRAKQSLLARCRRSVRRFASRTADIVGGSTPLNGIRCSAKLCLRLQRSGETTPPPAKSSSVPHVRIVRLGPRTGRDWRTWLIPYRPHRPLLDPD